MDTDEIEKRSKELQQKFADLLLKHTNTSEAEGLDVKDCFAIQSVAVCGVLGFLTYAQHSNGASPEYYLKMMNLIQAMEADIRAFSKRKKNAH